MGGTARAVKDHLDFSQLPRTAGEKTWHWEVYNLRDDFLGVVAWYTGWRRYVFTPAHGRLVFDASCLTRLASFCTEQTTAQRAARQREKERGDVKPQRRRSLQGDA